MIKWLQARWKTDDAMSQGADVGRRTLNCSQFPWQYSTVQNVIPWLDHGIQNEITKSVWLERSPLRELIDYYSQPSKVGRQALINFSCRSASYARANIRPRGGLLQYIYFNLLERSPLRESPFSCRTKARPTNIMLLTLSIFKLSVANKESFFKRLASDQSEVFSC